MLLLKECELMTVIFFCPCLRSTYVTYASKEVVDQAVALTGMTFLSRILKVCCFFLGSNDVLQLTNTKNVNSSYEIEMVKVRKPKSYMFLPC